MRATIAVVASSQVAAATESTDFSLCAEARAPHAIEDVEHFTSYDGTAERVCGWRFIGRLRVGARFCCCSRRRSRYASGGGGISPAAAIGIYYKRCQPSLPHYVHLEQRQVSRGAAPRLRRGCATGRECASGAAIRSEPRASSAEKQRIGEGRGLGGESDAATARKAWCWRWVFARFFNGWSQRARSHVDDWG